LALRRWVNLLERVAGPRDERGGRLWAAEAQTLPAEAKRRRPAKLRTSMEEVMMALKESDDTLELPTRPPALGQEVPGALERLVKCLAAVKAKQKALW